MSYGNNEIGEIRNFLLELCENNIYKLLDIANEYGIDKNELLVDLETLITEKILMYLYKPTTYVDNYIDNKNIITKRVNKSKIIDDNIVEKISEMISKLESNYYRKEKEPRKGISNITANERNMILNNQGYRCNICGIPLSNHIRNTLKNGFREPKGNPTLEHDIPYYFGGNYSANVILCEKCNQLKQDFIGIQEDGLVMCSNHIRSKLNENNIIKRSMLWT
ncbi:hypothetical protein K8I28_16330, partial [bacterium]|nr:hypothetical protein [bacterium]